MMESCCDECMSLRFDPFLRDWSVGTGQSNGQRNPNDESPAFFPRLQDGKGARLLADMEPDARGKR